jgi:murein endopeptidase
VRIVVAVASAYRRAHPDAPRLLVGDLSRPRGGDFGRAYGGLGHVSHQNGLDADVYYPRTDRLDRPPRRPEQVDLALAQELVDRFVAAGAEKVFVGPSLPLSGPSGVVAPLPRHDNHLHVRIGPQ